MTVDEFLQRLDTLPDAQLITEKHLSAWLSVSVSKLQKDRVKGHGPRHVKVNNAVRYRVRDIRHYIAESMHVSTSTHVGFAMEIDDPELDLSPMIPYAMRGGIEMDFFGTLDEDIDEIVWRYR